MKEIRTIVNAFNQLDHKVSKAALVTVVGLKGSSYRRMGARMLVIDDGNYIGGISGGCLEGDALKRARIAILKDHPSIVTYDTTQNDDQQVGVGLGCNGIIDVLFVPLDPADKNNPVNLLASIIKTRTPRVLLTFTKAPDPLFGKSILFEEKETLKTRLPDSDLPASLLPEIRNALSTKTSTILNLGDTTVFLEVIVPEINLIVYGNNNDIVSISVIAKELGWNIFFVMNPQKAGKKHSALAEEILDIKHHSLDFIDEFSAIVIMSHNYKIDLGSFPNCLKTSAFYFGILGPKNRFERLLVESGIKLSDENATRIFAPCGLDIGAITPEEIALSIIAEIKSKFADREGGFLKLRDKPINEN